MAEGGGGSDYSAPAAPVQNENSVLNMTAPSYRDVNLNITPATPSLTVGSSVTFRTSYAPTSEDASYTWYVDGANQNVNENSFAYTASSSGSHQLMLIIKDGDNYVSDSKPFTVMAAN
ncbi:MAG: PKD domain-containing protein [Treponema sp.]|nr:PKD domain-containing protein [Treponema sp.]